MAELERDAPRRQSEIFRELLKRVLAEWDNMPEPTRTIAAAQAVPGAR
jgi:hypothetical protein